MYRPSTLPAVRTVAVRLCAALFALAALPALVASPAAEQPTGDRVLVVATTNIVADIVARIGGERISLSVIMPLGADPHLFQPTPRDVRLVADAAVVFANGAGLEDEFLGDLISSAEPHMVVELSAHLPLRRLDAAHADEDEDEHRDEDDHDDEDEHDEDEHDEDEHGEDEHGEDEHGEDEHGEDEHGEDEHDEDEHDEDEHDEDEHDEDEHDEDEHDEDEHGEDEHDEDEHGRGHGHGEFDPHVWMDPTLVAGWADEIAEVLADVDPEHGDEYAARASELAAELHELDEWIMAQVEVIAHDRRIIVTDHDVLAYFAQRYGFELLDSVVPGVSTAAEPSVRHLAELRELIAEHGIPAIFVGTTVNPQVAEVIAADLGIVVVPIYTGSLSESGGPADSYDRFMRTNVERIVTALDS